MPVFKLLLPTHAQFWLPAVQDKMSYHNLPFLPLNPFDVKKNDLLNMKSANKKCRKRKGQN